MPVDVDFSRLQKFMRSIDEATIEGLTNAGEMIKNLASELAPKDTGELSESGEVDVDDFTVTVSFGNGLPDQRAVANEFGTYALPASPYLGPAAKEIDSVLEVAKALEKKL